MDNIERWWVSFWMVLIISFAFLIGFSVRSCNNKYIRFAELGYQEVTVQGSSGVFWQK